jgi:hypothetical protein
MDRTVDVAADLIGLLIGEGAFQGSEREPDERALTWWGRRPRRSLARSGSRR